ncbi:MULTISPECIES: hypothetical protein [Nocardia]|uniref:Uncharacterized protein n=1 Tax=Nocardia salmonicida TaxID=53431 RepID=A0ABZ1N918_9NOCA|nr:MULTISPECIES: hypothetical protein [Nocardia]KQY39114.1 hypothetical protein ASD42_12640 [Nocardia sp. Root136]
MIDDEPARPLDEVPEADRIEQEQSAFRDDDPDDPAYSDAAMAADIAREADTANPADVIEQTIPVPFDEADEGFTGA